MPADLGPPVVPFHFFLGEGSPTKIDYRRKGTLLLEDLETFRSRAGGQGSAEILRAAPPARIARRERGELPRAVRPASAEWHLPVTGAPWAFHGQVETFGVSGSGYLVVPWAFKILGFSALGGLRMLQKATRPGLCLLANVFVVPLLLSLLPELTEGKRSAIMHRKASRLCNLCRHRETWRDQGAMSGKLKPTNPFALDMLHCLKQV